MKKSYLVMMLLLALLIVSAVPTVAQGPFVFCGDLPDADCTLLKDTQTASADLHSGTSQFDMSLSVTNVPNAPVDSINIGVTGNGAFAIDPALTDSMKALHNDPTTLFSSPDALSKWLTDFVKGFSGDLNLTVTLPEDLAAMASSDKVTVPTSLSIGLRMVDGVGYVNLADIAAAAPDAGIPDGWTGIDLATLLDTVMKQGAFGAMNSIDPSVYQSYMSSFMDPNFMKEFMTVERQADTDVMGQKAAVFLFTIDYGALLQSDAFKNMMTAQMNAVGSMAGTPAPDQQAQMEQAFSMMGPMFKDLHLTITETVGLDDQYVHGVSMHMDWDMTALMAMAQPDAKGPAPVFNMDINVTSADFNAPQTITAPEGATIIPLDSLMSSNHM